MRFLSWTMARLLSKAPEVSKQSDRLYILGELNAERIPIFGAHEDIFLPKMGIDHIAKRVDAVMDNKYLWLMHGKRPANPS